jgi:hypothetical protein
MTETQRIELTRKLFEEGWSGGTPESPLPFLTEDAVMRDILGHPEPMRGHTEIAAFFAPVAKVLRVMPEEYFLNGDGLALTWIAYIEITGDSHGPENRGRYLCGEGMSRVEFSGDRVCLEIDYWKGPQGMCDDWRAHFEGRRQMTRAERGATPGCR